MSQLCRATNASRFAVLVLEADEAYRVTIGACVGLTGGRVERGRWEVSVSAGNTGRCQMSCVKRWPTCTRVSSNARTTGHSRTGSIERRSAGKLPSAGTRTIRPLPSSWRFPRHLARVRPDVDLVELLLGQAIHADAPNEL